MSITTILIGLAVNVVVITTLVLGVYRPRHSKSDLALSYIVLNLGVFGAVALLAEAPSGLALGMGLFGILSIIRLRSSAISQTEVAYYFVALVLGLVNSLGAGRLDIAVPINLLLLVTLAIFDRGAKALAAQTETRRVVLDVVHPDADSLHRDLEFRLNAAVVSATIEEIDYLREVTTVQVEVEKPSPAPTVPAATHAPTANAAGSLPSATGSLPSIPGSTSSTAGSLPRVPGGIPNAAGSVREATDVRENTWAGVR